ncbi:MAG: FecR domain-containing protein [Rikenellaceae bacterium]|nr:FecR domain-containing protein [Rikenellaceae bacterium]MCL2693302.1 FecR domain-containing protein [Rikenellaceae bacterium]
MSEYNKSFATAQLLARLAAGALLSEEAATLEQWAAESPENRAVYDKWADGRTLQTEYATYNAVETAKPCAEMKRQIAAFRKRRSRQLARRAVTAAAIAAMMVVGGVWMLRENNPRPEIRPLTAEAPTLRFDDGREIALRNEATILVRENGMVVEGRDGTSQTITAQEQSHTTLRIPRGYVSDITLEDGTRVWLNADSELRYPVAFRGEEREVTLRGEAYFEVAHDAQRPFRVSVEGQRLEVLGTKFNITAYGGSTEVLTTLISGSVRLSAPRAGSAQILAPGEQATLDTATGMFGTRAVDVRQYTAWRDGIITVDERTMAETLVTIERSYNVCFELKDPQLAGIIFKGRIPRYDDLWDVLDILGEMSGATFRVKGEVIYVSR